MENGNISVMSGRNCTGCGVCSTVCPGGAISMKLDEKGFLKAQLDGLLCIKCGKCMKVCSKYFDPAEAAYVGNLKDEGRIYMAYSSEDKIRYGSSSGGIGYELSKKCLSMGYDVCGAFYIPGLNRVEHGIASSLEGILPFMGSKYLQSNTKDAFSAFQRDRKYVVFGTPCQIYALRKKTRLENIEDKFILVDFFCHGIPSNMLWNSYMEYINRKYKTGRVKEVNFRDKRYGWHDYSMKIAGDAASYLGKMRSDLFFLFYLSNVCMNDACYKCSFRLDHAFSDIRLGDFWGRKYGNDRKGISLVTLNTEKGRQLFEAIKQEIIAEEAKVEDLLAAQPAREIPVPPERDHVLAMLMNGDGINAAYKRYLMKGHLKSRAAHFVKGLVPVNLRSKIRKLIK